MIHLDESDCFNAWLSCGDAADVVPKIIDEKRKLCWNGCCSKAHDTRVNMQLERRSMSF